MEQKKKYIIMALVTVLIVGGGYGLYKFRQAYTEKKATEDAPSKSSHDIGDLANSGETYVHPEYGFTFKYPSNLEKTEFEEGDGEIILFRSQDGNKEGFQIYVSTYGEAEDLSIELIKRSALDVGITNDKKTQVGPDSIEAVQFDAEKSPTDKTHEVWLVKDGIFYQMTSYQEYGKTLDEIMKTWRFI